MDFLKQIFDTSDFPPRWQCGAWTEGHGWLHIVADLGVWSAYVAIPCVLGYFVLRRKDIPFRRIFWLFGAFILACGTTHLMEALIFWWPAYRLAGLIKLCTALVSWGTVLALVQVTPRALAMRSPEELEREIAARIAAEEALARANAELERRVEQRTAELERANAALRASEQRLMLALQAGRMGTWEWDVAAQRVTWSPSVEAIHGLGPGAFAGTFDAYREDIHPDDRGDVERSIAATLETGKDYRVEYRIVWPDGSIHWLETRGMVDRDPSGKPLRMIGVCMDIDDRKRVEEEVRFQARLLDTVRQAAIATAPDGTILYWNRFAEILYGWSKQEVVGRDILDVTPAPQAAERAAEIMERLARGESWSGELLVQRRDGSVFPALVTDTPVLDDRGEMRAVIGVTIDITEQKRIEDALRFMADASATLAFLVDYESTLQRVASLAVPRFADWCTVDVLDEDGTPRRLAVAHADPAKTRLARELELAHPTAPDGPRGTARVLRTGRPDMIEEVDDELLVQAARDEQHLRILRELAPTSYICVPLQGRSNVLGAITFVLAESRRRYTKADLAFAEELARRAATALENARLYAEARIADQRKNHFLATLAHELRNPLAPIRNGLQILRMTEEHGTRQAALAMMERQLGQLVRLVDDLLDLGRISRDRLELRKTRIALSEVIANAVETARPLIDARNHELSVSLPPEPVHLDADLTRLAQVFWNLLNNSAKYTDRGGRIEIVARRDGDEVVVSVRDDGIGIAAEAIPELFTLFSQVDPRIERSQGGLGIGLALVKGLVEMHAGRVEARSAGLGQGSEFVVRLPVAAARTQDEPASAPPPPSALGRAAAKRRVLVVDDNRDVAASLALMLRLAGHDAREAHDGLEAVEAVEAFAPDVVLLDLGMPRLDGFDAARRIRTMPLGRDVVLIALSGWGQEDDRRNSKEAGFDAHLVKPVDPAELGRIIDQARRRSNSE